MLGSSGPSTPTTQHKRKDPLPNSPASGQFPVGFHVPSKCSVRRCLLADPSEVVSTNEINVRLDKAISCDADLPASSHIPSGRSTRCRRHLCHPIEFPHPDPMTTAQSRKKRKIAMLGKSHAARLTSQDLHRYVRPRVGPSQSCTSGPSTMYSCPNIQSAPLANGGTVFSPFRLGPPRERCRYCGAFFWFEERVRRDRHASSPTYKTCCKEGSVILPPYKPPPQPLHDLLTGVNRSLSTHFFENIRCYNSMFAFTSMGVNVIDAINAGHGPYVFKISGQLCHRIGSLMPIEGRRPEYAQLYIFDTDNEVRNRMHVGTYANRSFHPNPDIVAALIDMLNTHNPIVQLFRTARDRLAENNDDRYIIRLFGEPDKHGDIFSATVASEVVGLVVGDVGISDVGRDLIVQDQAGCLHKVQETHRKFMAMQYPILFPYGEDGYHENITYRRCARSEAIKRNKISMLEYFAYRLHDRADEFNTPMRCKRGTQSYVINGYCCMEESRLNHYRSKSFQLKYRSASFKVREIVHTGITEASQAGQRVILLSSFVGGPRYLYQNYLDSVALCRRYGCPDLFITFTSNPLWSEDRCFGFHSWTALIR